MVQVEPYDSEVATSEDTEEEDKSGDLLGYSCLSLFTVRRWGESLEGLSSLEGDNRPHYCH